MYIIIIVIINIIIIVIINIIIIVIINIIIIVIINIIIIIIIIIIQNDPKKILLINLPSLILRSRWLPSPLKSPILSISLTPDPTHLAIKYLLSTAGDCVPGGHEGRLYFSGYKELLGRGYLNESKTINKQIVPERKLIEVMAYYVVHIIVF